MRPVWLVDFDGVVNALSSSGGRMDWDDRLSGSIDHPLGRTTRGGAMIRLPLLWSPTVVRVLGDAVAAGVDVRWLSTWREHTRQLPTVIDGLPVLPWLDESVLDDTVAAALDPEGRMASGAWKFACAKAYVPDEAPLLWTDDAAYLVGGMSAAWRWRRAAETRVIAPRPASGLGPRDVAKIREWIAAVA